MPAKVYIVLVTTCMLLAGCSANDEAVARHQAEYVKTHQGDIVIAAVQDIDKRDYIDGASLAVRKINQPNGGLLRPAELILEQGYDSVMPFSSKVESAQSTLPALLASTVNFSPPWVGVTGTYRFNTEREIEGKKHFFQILNSEKWQPHSANHTPVLKGLVRKPLL